MKKLFKMGLICIASMMLFAGCGSAKAESNSKKDDSTSEVVTTTQEETTNILDYFILSDEIKEMAEKVIAEAELVLNGDDDADVGYKMIDAIIREYESKATTNADDGALTDSKTIRSELSIYDESETEMLQKFIDYLKSDIQNSEDVKNQHQ